MKPQMKYLDKVTLVIIVHYRDAYRSLEYYRDVNVNILVADSNPTPFPQHKQYKNVRYFRYAPHTRFNEKMADIFQHVNTSYVAICPDDDFIVPSGIMSCIEFLETHPDYATVQGHYVQFTAEPSGIIMVPLYVGMEDLHIRSDNTADRLKLSMNPCMQWYYSVHRTETLRTFFQDIHSDIPIQTTGEIALTLISAISGKLKILPVFYAARDSYYHPNRPYIPSIVDAKTNPELRREYDIFLSLVTDYFCNMTGRGQVEGRRYVEQAIEDYIAGCKYKRSMKYDQISGIRKILDFIKPFLPEVLLQYYRGWRIHRIIGDTQGYPFTDLEAKKEWKTIESVILKHN